MSKSIVDYWTIGWNKNGSLIPIPVWKHIPKDSENIEYFTEKPEVSAKNRGAILVLVNPIFEVDSVTIDNEYHPGQYYTTESGLVHAFDCVSAIRACRNIRKFWENRENAI